MRYKTEFMTFVLDVADMKKAMRGLQTLGDEGWIVGTAVGPTPDRTGMVLLLQRLQPLSSKAQPLAKSKERPSSPTMVIGALRDQTMFDSSSSAIAAREGSVFQRSTVVASPIDSELMRLLSDVEQEP